MKSRSPDNSALYHEKLSLRYNQRKAAITTEKLKSVLQTLGFDVDLDKIHEPHFGCNNRTLLTDALAVKIRDDRFFPREIYRYLANCIASENFYPLAPVPHVVAYDHFDKTDYEILVMERGEGKLLIDDFLEFDEEKQKNFYGQIIDLANQLSNLTFRDWGDIRRQDSYDSFRAYVTEKMLDYSRRIIEQNLIPKEDIVRIRDYFLDKVSVFQNEKRSHFIHTDLTIANVLYSGDEITLLHDFDSAAKAPPFMMLPMLIASIDNLGIIVDGTNYYKTYRDLKFEHLYPVLAEKMGKILTDKNICQKLNLILIMRGFRIVAENRYSGWNKVIIRNILNDEIMADGTSLDDSYYGQILQKMGV